MGRLKRYLLLIVLPALFCVPLPAQVTISGVDYVPDYNDPKEYEIGGITVSGVRYLDHEVLVNLSGLNVGDKITLPTGGEISDAIRKLWKQGLFSDIEISIEKIIGDIIFLDIFLQERPRLSRFSISGVRKSEADDIRDMIKLVKGSQITDNIINNSKNIIKDYFVDKGFYNTVVTISKKDDSTMVNNVIVDIVINKKERVKINEILIEGNEIITDGKLRRSMKDTKQKTWYNIFKSSKFIDSDFKTDKQKLITKYNENGFRDAYILSDTVVVHDEKTLNVIIKVDEGRKYYFRDIVWVGNTKYKSDYLNGLLGIKKGDVYNQTMMDENLNLNPNGVFSLYQDNGYLFSFISPVEVNVENDSIDIEMQVYEGKQATIDRVTITGNTKTNEHVIRREIRSRPGQLYSRSDITRSIRELATLGYFDPEKLNLNPTPKPEEGTVDLEYIVEEKPSDQIELSGGWGANMIVGTLGVTFSNFSARNFFKKNAWRPLPSGDGQRLSLRAQSNGKWYQSYNMMFVEPWLGGKKPNSLTTSVYHTIYTSGLSRWSKDDNGDLIRDSLGNKVQDEDYYAMKITGVALGFGKRLSWPDDFFTLYEELSYQNYNLNNYTYRQLFDFNDGVSNNISLKVVFGRNSIDAPIYPRSGSMFSLTGQLTPPYSLVFSDRDYINMADKEKYKFIEYHKWKFESSWFSKLAGNLVLNARAEFGYLGMYNKDWGHSPFEGFNLGGDGLMTYNIYGMETIALRGYENGSLTPDNGGNLYD
ncbi:MAG: outer membrane protein assembly factor BamA, partial [Bacteroidota bacterium]